MKSITSRGNTDESCCYMHEFVKEEKKCILEDVASPQWI